jgi:hypothetical protein
MITEAKNKGRPRKKKAEKTELPKESKEAPVPTRPAADKPQAAPKCSCPACHATVDFTQTYKCQNCGVYGCEECGFEPKAKICPKCGAKR